MPASRAAREEEEGCPFLPPDGVVAWCGGAEDGDGCPLLPCMGLPLSSSSSKWALGWSDDEVVEGVGEEGVGGGCNDVVPCNTIHTTIPIASRVPPICTTLCHLLVRLNTAPIRLLLGAAVLVGVYPMVVGWSVGSILFDKTSN